MNRHNLATGMAISFLLCSLGSAQAQKIEPVGDPLPTPILNNGPAKLTPAATAPTAVRLPAGQIVVPQSSTPPATQGTTLKTRAAQTNVLLYVPEGWKPDQVTPPSPKYTAEPPFTGYAYETPASLSCVYVLVSPTAGCNPNTVSTSATGGTKAIAIVDAYDDPFAGPDLAYYSSQFALPFNPTQLQVVYEDGLVPAVDTTGGWEVEESLDIEMAHAMAPNATIYLVEAQSNFYSDLLTSVQIASNLIQCGQTEQNPTTYAVGTCPSGSNGTGEVSMSWGGGEFSGETADDSYFTTPGVVYLASSGDSPGTIWPCTSPDVVCAGGTSIRRSPSTGNYLGEAAWNEAGSGSSLYEPAPSAQTTYIPSIVGTSGPRAVPDVSFDANPITGVWVWDSFGFALDVYDEPVNSSGWYIVGGTSVASPALAGIVNRAGGFAANSGAELTTMYKNMSTSGDYRDIGSGFCGPYQGYSTATGWDFCTGIGSDEGYSGK
jgi:kumamolisin